MEEIKSSEDLYNTELEVNVSFFEGLTIPYDGSIKNIQPSNFSIENIFVGAFNKMAQYYDDMFAKLSLSEKEVEKIIFSGGAARKNKILRDLIAQKIGLQAELVPFVEDTLVGLFQLALVCSGFCKDYQEAEDYSQNLQIVE
jgi:sugar (pentulose or hexulose) kinase